MVNGFSGGNELAWDLQRLVRSSSAPLAAVEALVPEGVEGLSAEWEGCFKDVDVS